MQIKKTLKPPSPSLPTLRERLEPATQFPRRTLLETVRKGLNADQPSHHESTHRRIYERLAG